jgi:GMP synthase-like glutamine amidotransferase
MEKVLIVKNITREGPGLLEDLLKEQGRSYDTIDLTEQPFPDVTSYGGLVVLGGPDSANDQNSKIEAELERIQKALQKGIPYLGICLGLQALVKAAGGKVVPSPVREVGFRDPDGGFFTVALTDKGRADKLFSGLGDVFSVFHLHGETVELTSEMELLGTGKFCQNQIVKVGESAYGIQSHFELTPAMFTMWLDEDPDLQKLDRSSLEADFERLSQEYRETGRTLLQNFLALIP